MLKELQQPEYLHVLLNPMPIYGLGIAVLGLIIAFISRSRAARMTALALVCFTAASAWPVMEYGAKAYDRVQAMENDEGSAWLKEHKERAEGAGYVYYALVALALAAVLVPLKWPPSGTPLAVATLVLAFAALAVGAWVGYAGGKVRHSEFRNGPPPGVENH